MTAPAGALWAPPRYPWLGLALAGVGAGVLVAAGGAVGALLVLAGTVGVVVAFRPELGAYLYLIVTPLIVGLPRGELIPLLRPNEAFVLLVLLGLGARIAGQMLGASGYRPGFTRIDALLVLMAVASSVLPLALRYGRGEPISLDDVLYATVLWKYWVVYRLFCEAVATPEQVRICLRLAMVAAILVAVIAMLQVLQLFGVAEFLWRYYDDPFSGSSEVVVTSRATSTIAYSFGVADIMIMNLAIAIAWGLRAGPRERVLLGLAGVMFVLGVVAAGQVSGLLGLAVAVVTIGILSGHLGRLVMIGAPLGVVAAVLFWPVIATRLAGFDGPHGLPESWVGRIENLERYILPRLGEGLNWLTGVRPSARLEAPEAWRDFIWIESGYVWLIWVGGAPLLLAFVGFLVVALGDLRRTIQTCRGPVQVAALAAFTSLITIAVLMVLDPHLTTRGSADLLFPLLALASSGAGSRTNKIDPSICRSIV